MKNKEKIPVYLIENIDILNKIYEDVKIVGVRVRSSDNRLQCAIKWKDGSKLSTAARLMLEIKMGRRLDIDETADHIDGDPTNDTIDNLQMLSRAENSRKGPSAIIKQKVSKQTSDFMLSSFGDYCRGVNNNFHVLTEKEVREIRELQKSYTKGSGQDSILAEKYNVTRGAIKAIRHCNTWKHLI